MARDLYVAYTPKGLMGNNIDDNGAWHVKTFVPVTWN